MEHLKEIIKYLQNKKVRFADVRDHSFEERELYFEDKRIKNVKEENTQGVGIRVLYENGWGYASTPNYSKDALEKACDEAFEIAKFADKISNVKVELAEEPCHRSEFSTKIKEDPFHKSLGEIAHKVISANEEILRGKDIIKANAQVVFRRVKKQYANTQGSEICTKVFTNKNNLSATARANNEVKVRTYDPAPITAGYEYFKNLDFQKEASRVAEEAREHCFAKPCESGTKTLILDPVNLSLTMHESIGHPTELDRILGYEESCAGRSHAVLDKLNTFRYGSEIVNFVADNTMEGGLSSCGYDDEGVECQKWNIVKNGILVGYGANREVAHKMGLKRATGTTWATRYYDVPIVRIPNLYLAPGEQNLSLNELIADTKDGIYVEGMGSFSIDQMRLNMQFGGDAFWEIKNGKIVGMLKDVIYNAISYEFWRSCDAICDERYFQRHGFITCGKGDPMQLAQMSHGASPARFRNITVRSAK